MLMLSYFLLICYHHAFAFFQLSLSHLYLILMHSFTCVQRCRDAVTRAAAAFRLSPAPRAAFSFFAFLPDFTFVC